MKTPSGKERGFKKMVRGRIVLLFIVSYLWFIYIIFYTNSIIVCPVNGAYFDGVFCCGVGSGLSIPSRRLMPTESGQKGILWHVLSRVFDCLFPMQRKLGLMSRGRRH